MNKKIIITGPTGTLGKAVVNKLLKEIDLNTEIIGISRDEQKQRQMPVDRRLKMKLCDIRDIRALRELAEDIKNAEYVFHFAALKCVDTLESNPIEAYRTNVEGTRNVCNLAKSLK